MVQVSLRSLSPIRLRGRWKLRVRSSSNKQQVAECSEKGLKGVEEKPSYWDGEGHVEEEVRGEGV